METIWWLFCWVMMAYLVGKVSYQEGRKSKWEEMSKEYICIHKSVLITHNLKKTLDKPVKKRYNKTSYKRK